MHAPDLVSLYKVDENHFETFDLKQTLWMILSIHTPAQNISTSTILHFRSRGVKSAPEMPSGTGLRVGKHICEVVEIPGKEARVKRQCSLPLHPVSDYLTISDDEEEAPPPRYDLRAFQSQMHTNGINISFNDWCTVHHQHHLHLNQPRCTVVSRSWQPLLSLLMSLIIPARHHHRFVHHHRWPYLHLISTTHMLCHQPPFQVL